MDEREIEDAIIEAISESKELRLELGEVVDDVADTWRALAPVDEGDYKASIRAQKSRRNKLGKAIATTGVQIGEVYSTDSEGKVAAIEYGRDGEPGPGGGAPMAERAPMRRAVARFNT